MLDIGVKVAALMTEEIILRRLPRARRRGPDHAARPLPRRPRALDAELGVPVVRGPDELKDLPAFLGRGGMPPDLSRTDIRIFAEIVEASALSIEAILERARGLSPARAPT